MILSLSPLKPYHQYKWIDWIWYSNLKFPYLIHLFNQFFAAKSSAYMQAIEQMAFLFHMAVSNSLNRWIRWSYSSLKVGI